MTILKTRSINVLMTAIIIAAAILLTQGTAWASPTKAPKQIKAVFLGDRLIDIAYNLGFVAEGMSLRCSLWPKCKEIKNASQVLGCPNCIVKKKPKALPRFLKERGIKRVIVERTPKFCLYAPKSSPEKAVALIKDLDVQIDYVDFSKGVPSAIRQVATLLNAKDKGEELAHKYKKDFENATNSIPAKGLGKRVVILNGIFQQSTKKTFLRVEAAGGYADQYLLTPLGCENVGNQLFSRKPSISRGHIMLRSLKGLTKVRPDVIVITGDTAGVQLSLQHALKKYPELAKVPALSNLAIFALPSYVDSGVIEYPAVFNRWLSAFESTVE